MGVCTGDNTLMQLQKSETFFWAKETTSLFSSQTTKQLRECRTHQIVLNSSNCFSCNHNCHHFRKRTGSNVTCNNLYQIIEHPTFIEKSSMNFIDNSQSEVSDLLAEMKCEGAIPTMPSRVVNNPNSPPAILAGPDDCAGCGRMIKDRFYLLAIEKRWHASCLQCNVCRRPLDRETSCFSKDGNIYCKSDYYRAFGTRKCSKCFALINSSELVMRVKDLVFHIECFSCTICQALLTKGEEFGLRDSSLYCKLHYETPADGQPTHLNSLPNACSFRAQFGILPAKTSSPNEATKLTPAGFYVSAAHFVAGLSQSSRQKGRPRKRKPKDMESMGSKLNLNTEYLDFGRGSHLGATSRTKRMRTSFKHHQLRTMKSYFAINHNPDAKDLKQLSQKTGLPKRVLQVWFQNARAKWRRMMMKQDGKNSGDKNEISLDVESFNFRSSRSID